MGPKTLAALFVALLIGGCPKRQTGPRVVYVQAPPPAASPAAQVSGQASSATPDSGGALIIEQPAPPQPPAPAEAEVPAPPPAPAPAVRRPRRTHPGGQEGDDAAASDLGLPANAAEAPPLEPRSSPSSKDELQARHRVLDQRLSNVERSSNTLKFTAADRRTLEDARGFLRQSERALRDGDMIRAEQLAQKASLLLAALEQK